eukprot:2890546-Pyramimonas_sp.AAC.2
MGVHACFLADARPGPDPRLDSPLHGRHPKGAHSTARWYHCPPYLRHTKRNIPMHTYHTATQ